METEIEEKWRFSVMGYGNVWEEGKEKEKKKKGKSYAYRLVNKRDMKIIVSK